MVVLGNAFSASMLAVKHGRLRFHHIGLQQAQSLLKSNFHSVVGHRPTAEAFAEALQVPVEANREFYTLKPEDTLIIGSIHARLPESKVLNKDEVLGATIHWMMFRLEEEDA